MQQPVQRPVPAATPFVLIVEPSGNSAIVPLSVALEQLAASPATRARRAVDTAARWAGVGAHASGSTLALRR